MADKQRDDANQNDEFFMDEEELFAETKMSIIERELDRVLDEMLKKITECKSNLAYAERGEFDANFQIVSRYVSAVIEIKGLQEALDKEEIDEDQVLERVKEISLTVTEMSYEDLTKYEKSKNETVMTDEPKKKGEKGPDDDDFNF